jgi:hypothetical protein
VKTTDWVKGLQVTGEGAGLSHCRGGTAAALADSTGLTAGLSKAEIAAPLADEVYLVHHEQLWPRPPQRLPGFPRSPAAPATKKRTAGIARGQQRRHAPRPTAAN